MRDAHVTHVTVPVSEHVSDFAGRTTGPRGAGGPVILLIEDHDDVRAWAATVLRGAGHVVATANNGQEALAMLEAIMPALIVSDLEMPLLDGAGFRRRQLASPSLRHIPFVVMSGSPVIQTELDGLSAAAILRKPVTAAALLACVSLFAVAADRRQA